MIAVLISMCCITLVQAEPTTCCQPVAKVALTKAENPFDCIGFLMLLQTPGGVTITGFIHGLSTGKHGFHIHQKGNITNNCRDAGGHFNPEEKNHGGPDADERHAGDLGNIEADDDGVARVYIVDHHISLVSNSTNNVVGKAFVIHAGEDDLGLGQGDDLQGSLKTGNAGARVACGKIVKHG